MSQISAEIYGTLEVSVEGASSTITVAIGTPGPAASVTVGTTTTLSPGASASVTNVGTTAAAVLNFGIPAGQTGATGSQGPAGNAATIAVGTVTTLSPGASATVTNSGTSSAAVFDIGIPQGAVGNTGATGATGATGPAGPGVAAGGTTGQALVKLSGTNYDTGWSTIVPGDRYLTTSTTSLSVGTGSKTLTIGTGLAYTATQDVTIAYTTTPNNYHMHGVVTSYDTSTGVLVADIQHHTGSGTFSAWTVNVGGLAPAAVTTWGSITGTLSSQTDLQTALDAKAPLTSPALTGTPTAPTASAGTSTTQLATTAFVTTADNLKANLASPTFTGIPAAPTASAGTNTTQLATTAFVTNGLSTKANLASPTFTGTVTIPAGASITGYAPLASPTFTGTPAAPTAATSTNTTQIATTAYVKAQGYATLASPTFTGTVTIPAGASISGYLTTASASSTYQTLAGMSSYLTTSTAASTYQTIAGMSSYLTTSAAASTYQPIGSYLTDAPSDGNTYGRLNGAWSVVGGGGVAWGAITGTLSDQTDLQNALDAKLDLAGGTMTGGLTLSASGITFSDATTMTTAPAGSALAADQLTAGVVTTNPTTGPTASGDVLQYNGTDLIWAAGGGGGGVAWGAITGTVTDQTDLVSYISGLGYVSGTAASQLTAGTYTTNPASAPTTGQALTYDGTNLTWSTVGGAPAPSVTNVDMNAGNYTLVLGDGGNTINVNAGDGSSSGYVIYIPDNASVAFPIGTQVLFTCSQSSGMSYNYINGASGVTVVQASNSLNAGYMRRAVKLDTDTWMISSQI